MEVSVNVFDMLQVNKYLRFVKFGMYHSSIVLNTSKEIYYGCGTGSNQTGVFVKSPHFPPRAPEGPIYRTFYLGTTKFSEKQVLKILDRYQHSNVWKQSRYNIFYHNCNSFTLDFCRTILAPSQFSLFPFFISRGEKSLQFIFSLSLSHFTIFFRKNSILTTPPPSSEEYQEDLDLITEPQTNLS